MNIKGIGICEWALPTPMRGPDCCKLAKDYGLKAVELELGAPTENFPLANPYVIEAYREARAKYDITYTGIAVNLTDLYPMTAPSGYPERELVDYALQRGIDAAYDLSIPLIHVPSFCESDINTEEDLINTAQCLRYACDYAAEKGIFVCTENHLDTERQLREIELVNRENFKIYFDTQNYCLNGLNTREILPPIFAYIAEVHVKDGVDQVSTHLLGEGTSDVFSTLRLLEELRYDGWVILENYYSRAPLCGRADNPYDLLKRDIEVLTQWYD